MSEYSLTPSNQLLWNVDNITLQLCFFAKSTTYGAQARVSPIDLDSKDISTLLSMQLTLKQE